eukprot:jgi/Mesvir1/20514/Mv12395-RA.2
MGSPWLYDAMPTHAHDLCGRPRTGFEACLIAVYAGNRKGEGDVAAPTGDRTADDAGGSSTANVRGEGGSNGAGLRGESATSHSSRAGVSTRRSPGSFTMPSVTSPSLYNHMGSLAPGAAPIVEGDPAMLMLSPTGQVHDNFMFFATNSLCHKYGNGRLAYTDLPTPSSLVKGIAASARPVLVGCALGRWLEELPHVPAASQLLFVRFCCSVASMGCSWAHATVVSPSHTAGSSSVFSHASSSLPGPAPSLPNGKPSTLTVTHLSSPPAGDGRTAVEHMVPLSHPLLNHMVEGLAFLFFSTQGSGAPAFGRPDGQDVPGTGDAEGGGNAGGGDDDALGALEAACRVAVQVLHKRALYDLAPDAILLTHSLARVVNKVGGGAARPVVHELSRG